MMYKDIKAIFELACKVKKARRAEQKAYNKLTKVTTKAFSSTDVADTHERAMIYTSEMERDLSSLVIRLIVDRN
jgi:hypothetical protein